MRVAALYDIHGNLPALEAVLDEVGRAGIDRLFIGGDVLPGPMPRETLDRLLGSDMPVQFISGNGDLAVLAQMVAADPDAVTYWGTGSDAPMPEPFKALLRWTAHQLPGEYAQVLANWPKTERLDITGLGSVLFCHATPRSETEIVLRTTPDDVLAPIFDTLDVRVVVCGHTHMAFDRTIGRTRVLNAGSVGMPFGEAGAYWLLLGPDVEFRRTTYDLRVAGPRVRGTAYPQAEEFAATNVLAPPSEAAMLAAFSAWALK